MWAKNSTFASCEVDMQEKLGLKGHWTIEIRENGVLTRTLDFDNQLTNLYRDSVLNQLKGNAFDSLDIKYLAVGTDGTPSSASDTQLGAEIFRGSPTSKAIIGNYLQTIWVLTDLQANEHLREIGVFAGNATLVADSGILLSRVVIDIEKTSAMEITFIRRDIVSI